MPAPQPDAKSIFGKALELPDPVARKAYLDVACGRNTALRAEIEGLLAALDQAGGFLNHPPEVDGPTATSIPHASTASVDRDGPSGTQTVDHASQNEAVGTVIAGKYKLVEAIGEGGMGSVFLAQQSQPVKRLVAVKVIKAGMDSKAVLARFDAERQALAMMDHPNIAKVLDAGTTDSGRPYFVMELVKGVPITQFCDDRRLSPRQRLELFVPVCQAVQHAHQKGVIHRDIKPSNVLVSLYDDRPVPQVIDFGVAKATGPQLTDHTLVTGLGAVVGTPEYMSPEQASFNQLDVDTRSDIYALGVLLYELLTGTTPIDRKSLGKAALLEVLRMVREVEAPRPSNKLSTSDALPSISANRGLEPKKLAGLLRGELDWIVMKALEKDRARRYETANGFAADIQRYLAGEQVQAVPPSAGYRLRKFLRKNRGPVTAAGVVLLALTVGMIGTGWGLIEARNQRDHAEDQRKGAETARGLEAEQRRIAQDAVEAEGKAKSEETKQRVNAQNRANEAEAAKADALQSLYDARILTLRNAWEGGNVSQARALLEAMRPRPGEPDLRGFEWHYLDRQVHGASSVLVTPMVDGKRMYALPEVYDGGRVLLFRQSAPNGLYFDARSYDTATGQLAEGYKPIQGKYQTRNPLISSALLAFAFRRGESGTRFLHYHTPSPPSGRLWETNRPTDLVVYDARTGDKVADVPDLAADPEAARQGWQPSWPFAQTEHWFHLDRSLRASVPTRARTPASPTDSDSEFRLQVHDMKTGRVVTTMAPLPGKVSTLRFSDDGSRVLTVHYSSRDSSAVPHEHVSEVSVWDVASGKRLWFFRSPPGTRHVGFRALGQEVFLTVSQSAPSTPDDPTTARNTILAFDAATGSPRPARPDRFAAGAAFGYPLVTTSSDGRWVAVANRTRVDVRDAATGITWRTLKTEQPVHAAHFVDGDRTLRVIESLSPSGVRCSSLEVPVRPKPEEPKEPPPPDQSRSRSHQLVSKAGRAWSLELAVPLVDNEILAATEKRKPSDWSFRLRDARTGDVREIAVRADLGHFNKVGRNPPAFSGDGRIVVLGVRPAPETGKEKEPPDGLTHAVGIAVLDFNERKIRFVRAHAGHDDIVPRLSPDGRFLAYVHDRKLRVCDTRTDREIWTADVAGFTNSDALFLIEFSPDGKQVAVGIDAVTIYDSEKGGLVHTIPARDQSSTPPRSSSHLMKGFWSNDGGKFTRLADGQLRSWEVGTWAEVARLDVLKEGEAPTLVLFSPDYQHIAVGCRTAVSEESRFQVYAVATGRRCLAEGDTTTPIAHAVFSPDSSRLFLVDAPEKQNSKEPVKTVRVRVCDYRRDLYPLAIDTPIPESSHLLKLDATDNKVVLWFGAGETFTIDATPRTAAEVASARRPTPSDVELPDARVGPVLMTRPSGDLHAKYPPTTTLYTKNPKTASNYADVAVSSTGGPAIRAWREAIRLDPEFAPLHHELALALRSNNKPDEAIAAFRESLRIDPMRVESQHQLGLLLFQQGKPKEAIAPLREAVRLDPQHTGAFNELGCCLRDANDIPAAITAFSNAVALNKAFEKRFPSIAVMNPTFALPHRNLGELFFRQRNLERSVTEFKEAVRFAQHDAALHDRYGSALLEYGSVDEAIAAFQKAIQLNHGYAQARRNLGWVYGFVKKDFEKADAEYRKARDLAPKDASIFNDHGCLLRDNGKIDEGLAAFARATELAPRFWHPYWNRGHTFLARKQPERAVEEFRKAIEVDPRNEAGYNELAVALMRSGRASEGVQLMLTATKEHPELGTSTYPWVYNAACIAALGGTSTDTKAAPAAARAALRKQALDLLWAELASQKKDYEADPVARRGPKHQWMAHWLVDGDFNGVRSPEELALLPKDEQKAWQELWAEIRRFHGSTAPEAAPPPREK